MKPNACGTFVKLLFVFVFLMTLSPSILAADENSGRLEVVTVTAQKWAASDVQDVPMAITAIDEEFLKNIGANEFEDVYRFAPGLSVADGGPGLKKYIIRGISLEGSIPTVGQYVDEWLTAVDTTVESGAQFDARLFDVNRIEVLKGPQGTLYGASSMGGIVRIISNKPDLTQSLYAFEADYSVTDEADGSIAWKGMASVPLIENILAVRGSASYYDNSGWIENVVTGDDDINSERTVNVRGTLLWEPTSNVTLEASAMYQDSDFGSEQKVMANLPAAAGFDYGEFGTLFGIQNIAATPGTGGLGAFQTAKYVSDRRFDEWYGFSLRGDVELDNFTLTGIGTYARRDFSEDQDFWNLEFWHGPGAIRRSRSISDTTTLELRFATDWDKRVNVQGGYYHEIFTSGKPGSYFNNGMNANGSVFDIQRQPCLDAFAANGVAGVPETQTPTFDFACEFVMGTLQPEGAAPNEFTISDKPKLACTEGNDNGLLPTCSDFYVVTGERDRKQQAIFGELSFDVTEDLQIAYGFRYYELKAEAFGDVVEFNLLGSVFPVADTPKEDLPDEDDLLHKAYVSYDFSEDVMGYFLFSQGYRQGGQNTESAFVDFPLTFKTDSTDNFELGYKSRFFDNRVQLNLAAYWIEIDDIQTSLTKCGEVVCAGYIDNVGNARSKGIELEAALAVGQGWYFSGALNFGEYRLTEDSTIDVDDSGGVLPNPAAGLKGDRLPNAPEETAALSASYDNDVNIGGVALPLFANLTWTYTGDSFTEFNDNDPVYFKNDSYTKTRLRLGLDYDKWDVTLYVNNLFNELNDLGSRSRVFTTIREITINRPRTVGITFRVDM